MGVLVPDAVFVKANIPICQLTLLVGRRSLIVAAEFRAGFISVHGCTGRRHYTDAFAFHQVSSC